ncbi:hypothetical protein OE88DRAFT_608949 [Heliocybe sulcata]|uniref:Uncharacterized protein n=1 Tax=Heliocybe sulcata TaxID=5364 RepID=A0A5C3NH34_9AGAM|nr:hypothetical protein OE88DRAFT_608949 [Heliocybe sulcata]
MCSSLSGDPDVDPLKAIVWVAKCCKCLWCRTCLLSTLNLRHLPGIDGSPLLSDESSHIGHQNDTLALPGVGLSTWKRCICTWTFWLLGSSLSRVIYSTLEPFLLSKILPCSYSRLSASACSTRLRCAVQEPVLILSICRGRWVPCGLQTGIRCGYPYVASFCLPSPSTSGCHV